MANKLTEVISVVAGGVDTWTPMAQAKEFVVVATAAGASPAANITIQLRKATAVGGTNATNHGTAVTASGAAKAQLFAADLGEFSAGVPFTHVSAVITDDVSPDQAHAVGFLHGLDHTP
jgi:hypothetical protein